jgi:aspartyl-tRNA(Asn)/glutamyl-tRNA(Gln) amidotransferase subunit A
VTSGSIATAPLTEIAAAIRKRTLSAAELAEMCLQAVEAGKDLQAFITPPGQQAISQARQSERRRRADAGPLFGIPIAIKDLFATAGLRTTAGSRILRDWVPRNDAACVRRLRAADALVFGKANLHEFAYGVSNANPWWGTARNPRDAMRSPGGSSGGSAIAVTTGMAPAALGSDTGGSIRIPAALCGCVGLKPTYGAVPIDGAFPLGWSLDHAGPLTRTVDDAGLIFDVLSGSDAWSKRRHQRRGSLVGMRVGRLHGRLLQPMQPAVARQLEAATSALGKAALKVSDVEMAELDLTVGAQLVTLRAEATAVHARWIRTRPRDYGRDVRVRLQLGALVNASDYVMAQRMRERLRDAFRRVFQSFDVLVLPTTPITAPLIGSRSVQWRGGEEPVDGALVRLTAPFNLSGLPALSVPFGSNGHLPVGIQVVGRWNDEPTVLAVGRLIEDLSR